MSGSDDVQEEWCLRAANHPHAGVDPNVATAWILQQMELENAGISGEINGMRLGDMGLGMGMDVMGMGLEMVFEPLDFVVDATIDFVRGLLRPSHAVLWRISWTQCVSLLLFVRVSVVDAHASTGSTGRLRQR